MQKKEALMFVSEFENNGRGLTFIKKLIGLFLIWVEGHVRKVVAPLPWLSLWFVHTKYIQCASVLERW